MRRALMGAHRHVWRLDDLRPVLTGFFVRQQKRSRVYGVRAGVEKTPVTGFGKSQNLESCARACDRRVRLHRGARSGLYLHQDRPMNPTSHTRIRQVDPGFGPLFELACSHDLLARAVFSSH